jgi:hypothetical protein
MIFTDDINRLGKQIGTEVTKTSALEHSPANGFDSGVAIDL